MAGKPPVHAEPREEGWAVIREGNERATSLHPTQAEAGRDIARRDETEFFSSTPATGASEIRAATGKRSPRKEQT